MRAVVQRVKEATVSVDNKIIGAIQAGLLVFLGIAADDSRKDLEYLVDKIVNLRIFADAEGKMNLSALELGKEILLISQFTLLGDCRKGRRPNYTAAAAPEKAKELYLAFLEALEETGLKIASGEFQAMMEIESINDGPVTILLDSKKEF
ncbi:MAG TPA: D-tyrosyl-tRNA(Tyr) deacylase [Halanaerobiaceae bacterium]|jgi:D-tyrosyl-tRNA(Tyr) deacylase|nr:D-aminoacyl-tRNA deacylase [Bacillota bacterium]HHU91959.1 D-tyrosyl-tRNA(Tyr) deacylase [Halanaerobiaceae bacterium]HOA41330.1 D-aminoacyl-tRNA deacylase [Halanaerobiales bacterium]HPZ63463.1 D-aminoacyl-tRNA deacylase [Halanaerobiales bacterium]HQD04341.1 D-aminoacyl-tRNA deacylase [Halanaerobiales bacterium]